MLRRAFSSDAAVAAAAALLVLGAAAVQAQPTGRVPRSSTAGAHTEPAEDGATRLAGPPNARGGVVLVHDWFGVSPFYVGAADRLARQGYRVAAVDLYGGRRAVTHDAASALLRGLDPVDVATRIDAAVRALSVPGRKLAVMGFSMGGRPALEAALRDQNIAGAVVWYGETINDPSRLTDLRGRVLFVVGSRDGESAAQNAAAFSRAADAAGRAAEIYVYPGAAHAFAQPLFDAGKTYDSVATRVAWLLTENFLRRTLR